MLRYATVKHFQFLQMFSFFPKSSFLGSSTSVNSNNPYFFQNFQNFQLSAAIYYGKLREEIEKEFVAEIYKEIEKTEPDEICSTINQKLSVALATAFEKVYIV